MKINTKRTEECIEKSIINEEGIKETAKFYCIPLTPKEDDELIEKATEKDWDKGQRFTNLNFLKYKLSKVNKIIQRWEGVEDEDGNPLECNRLNKEKVFLNNKDLIDSVLEEADKRANKYKLIKEDSEKN